MWVTYKYLGFDATHVRLFTFNPTYAFYVAHSCHTYTNAIGAAIYPMARAFSASIKAFTDVAGLSESTIQNSLLLLSNIV